MQEFYTIWRHVGCRDYYSNIARCAPDPADDNYLEFCQLADTRRALHVGALEFPNSGDVYSAMLGVFMQDARGDLEFCLERYRSDSILLCPKINYLYDRQRELHDSFTV